MISFLILFTLSLSSCNKIMMEIYGFKSIKSISNEDIEYPKKYVKCDACFCTEADSSKYLQLVGLNQAINNNFKNKISQFLQVRIYINDTLTDMTVNCDLGGFPLLNWNKFGIFEKGYEFKENAYFQKFTWNEEIDLWKRKPIQEMNLNKANIKIVVYWVKFIRKQSRHLFKIVRQFRQKNFGIQFYFVNFDMSQMALDRFGSCEAP